MTRFLITGAAGFIGFHLSARLLRDGHAVVGLDALTNYYDPQLKADRLKQLRAFESFEFIQGALEDAGAIQRAWSGDSPQVVIHLAAQAGVRYSLESPETYMDSNVVGTYNLLQQLRQSPPEHLLFASTSSIYGSNETMPFKETHRTDFPVSLYAATKKAGEAFIHSYSHLFGIPATALRFFTVYGPWGRPDMALFRFVEAIYAGRPIQVYGNGEMRRDFTYIDDLVDTMAALIPIVPSVGASSGVIGDSVSPSAPFRTLNLGGGNPTELMAFIHAIEQATGREAEKEFLPMQPGDVVATYSDSDLLSQLIGRAPQTPVAVGVGAFVDWYLEYYAEGKRRRS